MPNLLFFVAALSSVFQCRTRASSDAESAKNIELKDPATSVEAGYRLDLEELSGLSWWPNPADNSLHSRSLAVSDKDFNIATFRIAADGSIGEAGLIDLTKVIATENLSLQKQSQWEGVTSDQLGRVFVLEESPGAMFVFDPTLTQLLNKINFIVKNHELQADWDADMNSRGEGIVLLKKGHILVAKEKNPSLIIEFGPANEVALGYSKDTVLTLKDTFELPASKQVDFVPLAYWKLSGNAKSLLEDISEITIDDVGSLYLLSDKSSTIARAEEVFNASKNKIAIGQSWKISPGLEKPEGLLIDASYRSFIGLDNSGGLKNFFQSHTLQR